MARLLLVRHGKTSDEVGRYYGHTDIGLSDEGIRQAKKLRDRLASEEIKAIYSSDLKRASLTAEFIASPHRLPVIRCPELRELHFGRLEGMSFDEIQRCYPEAAQLWSTPDPGIAAPGGETLEELTVRVKRFTTRLQEHSGEESILVVAHGGSLWVLLCDLLGMRLGWRWQVRLDLASLSIVETYPEGAVLCLLNDTSHLRND